MDPPKQSRYIKNSFTIEIEGQLPIWCVYWEYTDQLSWRFAITLDYRSGSSEIPEQFFFDYYFGCVVGALCHLEGRLGQSGNA